MDRRSFLTSATMPFLGTVRPPGAAPRNGALPQAGKGNLDESAVGQPVNLFRYGEIQSWLNPEITPLLRSRLRGVGRDRAVLKPSELPWKGSEFDIGVEWLEFRTINRIVV